MAEKKKPRMTAAARRERVAQAAVLQILSATTTRAGLGARLGQSYGGARDIYTALGWPKGIVFKDYQARYERQGIARAIIDAPVRASWRRPPIITEAKGEETNFEKEWTALAERLRIFYFMSRIDRLSALGEYAALLIGFQDGKKLSDEVRTGKEVAFVMPYNQENATIKTYEEKTDNARYGLPAAYSISMSVGSSTTGMAKLVHWSRVIHVAEDLTDDNVLGTPRLKPVWNDLMSLELVSGGCGEMFWRGAFPGLGIKVDENASLGKQDLAGLQDEVDEYMHGLKRYLRLEGMSVEAIAQEVADPSKHVDVLLTLISATSRIPKRVLIGAERGELASTQDEKNWAMVIDERRRGHCEQAILRPFIDRLIETKTLPAPSEGYTVEWPDLMTPSAKEQADVAEVKAKALKAYVDGIGAEDIIPPEIFLKTFLGLTQDQVTEIEDMIGAFEQQAAADEGAANGDAET